MSLSPGVVLGDETTTIRTRVSTISHQPASCPQSLTSSTARCHYLISLYNPMNYGPVKVSLRVDNGVEQEAIVIGGVKNR